MNLVEGRVDADAERASILPAHRVVGPVARRRADQSPTRRRSCRTSRSTRADRRAGTPGTTVRGGTSLGDHRAGAHHGLVADRDAHVDHGVGAEEHPVADHDRAPLDLVVAAAAHAARAEEWV